GSYQLSIQYLSPGRTVSAITSISPLLAAVVNDLNLNNTLNTATSLLLRSPTKQDLRFDYTYSGRINDSTDKDYYKIQSPGFAAAGPVKMNVIVWELDVNGLNPRAHVFDAAGNPVAFQVL